MPYTLHDSVAAWFVQQLGNARADGLFSKQEWAKLRAVTKEILGAEYMEAGKFVLGS